MNILRILCIHTMDLDLIHIYPHLSDPLVSTPLNFGSFFSLSCNPLVQLYYPYIHGCGAMC